MAYVRRASLGIQAGLLSGAALVVLFFLLDLFRLQPFSTPMALSLRILGAAGPEFDAPVLSQLISVSIFGANLLIFRVLHFMAFSFLGVSAVWGCDRCGVPLNFFTGAIYGVTVGSMVFYGSLALGGDHVMASVPGPVAVVLGNLVAGAVIGGFVQITRRSPA